MNISDLQWPAPGDPQKIEQWANEGMRGLIVARHGRTVYDWDMDRMGESLIAYITTIFVPRKLAGDPKYQEAGYVVLYHMTSPTTMQPVVDVPFLAPPLPREGEPPIWWTPVQEMGGAMLAEMERLLGNAPGALSPDTLVGRIRNEVTRFLRVFRRP